MNFNLKKLCFAEARATGIVNKMLKQCLNSDITKNFKAMLKFRYNQRGHVQI